MRFNRYVRDIVSNPMTVARQHSTSWLLFVLCIATINVIVAIVFLKTPFEVLGDSHTYFETMRFLQGFSVETIYYHRLIAAPLMLYSTIALSGIFGGLYPAMFGINVVLYYASVVVFFQLAYVLFYDKRIAACAAVLFVSNYGLYNFGTALLVDMGGWFFFLLATYYSVLWYTVQYRPYVWYAVAAVCIGALFKEYAVLAMVNIAVLVALSRLTIKEKVVTLVGAGGVLICVIGLVHLFVYVRFGYTYFDWYQYNYTTYADTYTVVTLLKVLGWLFNSGWLLFVIGLWYRARLSLQVNSLLLALLPASLLFLAWPSLTQRVAFVFVPWLALVAGYGVAQIPSPMLRVVLLGIYIIVNYAVPQYLMVLINLPL